MKIKSVQFQVPAATGNQDITTANLGGDTPKAVLFFWSYSNSNDTVGRVQKLIGMGAATSTTKRWYINSMEEDNVGFSNTSRKSGSTTCIDITNPSTQAVRAVADIVTFIANGVRLSWTVTTSNSEYITAIFFSGSEISVLADILTADATNGNTVDVNTVGFKPDVLFTAEGAVKFDGNVVGNAEFDTGIVTSDARQRSYMTFGNDNVDTTASASILSTAYGNRRVNIAAANEYAFEYGTFDASGFSVTTRLANLGDSWKIAFLAIKAPGSSFYLKDENSKSAPAGNLAYTGYGFQPTSVFFISGSITALDTKGTGVESECHMLGVHDSSSVASSYDGTNADNFGTSKCNSLSNTSPFNTYNGGPNILCRATVNSMDADGYTLNFSTINSQVRFLALAVKEGTGSRKKDFMPMMPY